MEDRKEKRNNNIKFTRRIRAGRRTYYLDVKVNSKGENYLVISENRKTEEGVKRQLIMVFPEDIDKFYDALREVKEYL